MIGSFLTVRAGRFARLLILVGAIQTPPTIAVAGDDATTGGFDALLPGWDAFSDLIANGWTDMRKAVESLPTFALPSPAIILTTRRACLDRYGETSRDCAAAVSFVCAQHGFATGRRIDVASGRVCRLTSEGITQTAHAVTCKPKVWLTQVVCW